MSEWLTKELKSDVKKVFVPRYKRELSDEEITEIASNLVEFTEHVVKFVGRRKDGAQ